MGPVMMVKYGKDMVKDFSDNLRHVGYVVISKYWAKE